MEINKIDFVQWQNMPCTEKFREDMIQVLDEVKAWLMVNAGRNQLDDRKMCGVIEGVQWLLDWQPTFIEDTEDATEREGSSTPD